MLEIKIARFQASEPAQPSGEENVFKLVWKAKKMEASQGHSQADLGLDAA